MTPWVERPTIDLDLAEAPGLRYARIADDVRADGRRLLEAVARDLPASARLLADIVRVRQAQGTASVFLRRDLTKKVWENVGNAH